MQDPSESDRSPAAAAASHAASHAASDTDPHASPHADLRANQRAESRINRALTVVSPASWLMLAGGLILVLAVVVWACCSWVTINVTASGIYHPGASEDGEIVAIVPLASGKTVEPGMEATVYLTSYNQQEYGHMKAQVAYVDDYVTSVDEMKALLGDDLLVSAFAQQGPAVAVVCKLVEDPATANGYAWSSARGGDLTVRDGSLVSVAVAVERVRPISVGIPALKELLAA